MAKVEAQHRATAFPDNLADAKNSNDETRIQFAKATFSGLVTGRFFSLALAFWFVDTPVISPVFLHGCSVCYAGSIYLYGDPAGSLVVQGLPNEP